MSVEITPLAPPFAPLFAIEPPRDCPLCPRLVAVREELRAELPQWWNAPVPALVTGYRVITASTVPLG